MILVTGGTGLIGSHLLYELAKKEIPVRALRREKSDLALVKKIFSHYTPDYETLFARIQWVNADITDANSLLDAMDGAQQVYHCAGLVSYNPGDAAEVLKVNAEGTANIVNVCLEKKISKLCHVSSVAAFGDLPKDKIVDETFFWKGCPKYDHYTISKYNAEREVWRGMEEGLNAVIVSPSVVVGPGNWNVSSGMIFKESYRGIRIYPKGGAGYVDVRDVVSAMIQLMDSDLKNERFILNAENLSFRDFANLVHDALGKKRPYLPAGPFTLALAWRLDRWRAFITGRPPVLTRIIARALQTNSRYSNEKIKGRLNFSFIAVKESVIQTASIFLKEKTT